MTVDEGRAALERGRPVVLVIPPAPEQAGALWDLLAAPPTPGPCPGVLLICADDVTAAEWAAAVPAGRRAHAVTGLRRTTRVLRDQPVDVLAGAVADLTALVTRSALKLDTLSTIVVAWPELLVTSEQAGALDTLVGAAPSARRIVLSWNPGALSDFLERHARRAEVVGALPVNADGKPLPPVGPARYAIAAPSRHAALVRDAIDLLDPKRPFIWRGGTIEPADVPDAVFCLRLPTREQFTALSKLGEPVVFVTGAQLPFLRSIATPLTPLPLPSAADRATDRAAALRARIAERIETGQHDAELALLDPLFERYDPAEVAGAMLGLLGDEGRGKGEAARPHPPASDWVKVFVNVGKKDRASAKDLVGALIKEVKVGKADIGRIDVRDTFSMVEVAATAADRVVQELSGVTIRGRRVVTRLDRYA